MSQSILGTKQLHTNLKYDYITLARVVNVSDNKIDVQSFDGNNIFGGVTIPAWQFVNGIDVTPDKGDIVLLGFLDSNKNSPAVLAFLKDKYNGKGFIKIKNGKVYFDTVVTLPQVEDLEAKILDLERRLSEFEEVFILDDI